MIESLDVSQFDIKLTRDPISSESDLMLYEELKQLHVAIEILAQVLNDLKIKVDTLHP